MTDTHCKTLICPDCQASYTQGNKHECKQQELDDLIARIDNQIGFYEGLAAAHGLRDKGPFVEVDLLQDCKQRIKDMKLLPLHPSQKSFVEMECC